jgi:hypothetical protein
MKHILGPIHFSCNLMVPELNGRQQTCQSTTHIFCNLYFSSVSSVNEIQTKHPPTGNVRHIIPIGNNGQSIMLTLR